MIGQFHTVYSGLHYGAGEKEYHLHGDGIVLWLLNDKQDSSLWFARSRYLNNDELLQCLRDTFPSSEILPLPASSDAIIMKLSAYDYSVLELFAEFIRDDGL